METPSTIELRSFLSSPIQSSKYQRWTASNCCRLVSSSAPDPNTQIAVLNKINAANVLLVRTMQDTNKLLAALLEQQLVTTERNRTSSVGSINTELYRQQHFGEVMSFTSSTPTRLQTLTGK